MHSPLAILLIPLLLRFYRCDATGSVTEIHVLHKPPSLSIQGSEISDVSKFILNLYGVNLPCQNEKVSIQFLEPFNYPKLIALIIVQDYNFLTNPTNNVFKVFDPLINVESKYLPIISNVNEKLVRLSSLHSNGIQPSVYYQKVDNSSQKDILSSLDTLIPKIASGVKDLVYIDISSDDNINKDIVSKLNGIFKMVFGENYVLLLSNNKEVSDQSFLKRKVRAVDGESESQSMGLGRIWASLVKPTPAKYSSIFNLIFWLSLLLALTVYAIVVALWHMDPGKDSIIYRVTNPRYNKKDL